MAKRYTFHQKRLVLGISSILLLGSAGSLQADSGKLTLDIKSQSLGSAMLKLAEHAGIQIMVSHEIGNSAQLDAIQGFYTLTEALDAMLTGSNLKYEMTSENVVMIRKKDSEEGVEQEQEISEEILVVGSNIRGLKESPSPVSIYTRDDIDKSGAATTHEFMQTLTQNFNGGATEVGYNVEGDVAGQDYAASNINGGSGINLRGLGNDSSLVLVNGHRVAPSSPGGFVDISMIPVTAIERVEVLTDGASAIYGSDAVGGVVNFVLRDNFEGAETRIRYGSVTSGELKEYQLGQTFGQSWDGGHALVSYEHYKHTHLDAQERSFSSDTTFVPYSLLPEQDRHSLFLTASQQLGDNTNLLIDAFYNTRDSSSFGIRIGRGVENIAGGKQLGITLGPTIELSDSWQLDVMGSYSTNKADRGSYYLDTGEFAGSLGRPSEHEGKTWSVDAKADGRLFNISAGDVYGAIGAHYRKESYRTPDFGQSVVFNESRDAKAVFGELFLPIIGENNQAPGLERLELTVAVRYEDYSAFGSTTDPKVGFLWSPFEGFNVRGSWGTSFRAPLFTELTGGPNLFLLLNFPDPSSPTGSTLALQAYGLNDGLTPEIATTWTTGFDFTLPSASDFSLAVNYFNIDFRDRIESVIAGFDDSFVDPRYSSVITYNPSQEFINEVMVGGDFFNYTIFPTFGPFAELSEVEAFFDSRLRNNAVNITKGIDFALSYDLETDLGDWALTFGGTYLLSQQEQVSPGTRAVDVVNTAFHPVDLRVRGGVNWNHEAISASLSVNYVDEYLDERVRSTSGNVESEGPVLVPPAIASWTTFDLNVSYNAGHANTGFLEGTVIALHINNLFDRDPPYLEANGFLGAFVNFDANNATAKGRFVSLSVTKTW